MMAEKIWNMIKKDKALICCVFIFSLFVFMGFVGYYFLSSPFTVHGEFLKVPPFWLEGGSFQFILGTDDLGRNLFSRLVHGARLSILIGAGVVIISIFVGTTLGLISGYFGGIVDQIIMRCVDALMSFPSILIAILIMTLLGPGVWNAIIAVNVTAWPAVIRLVRSVVLSEREKEHVQAARSFGASPTRILFVNILPQCSGPLIVQATLGFSEGILNVAALGFLGLGVEPPRAEWGMMISDGRAYMESAWWLITFPGLCLFALVLSVNIIGESLSNILNPKS